MSADILQFPTRQAKKPVEPSVLIPQRWQCGRCGNETFHLWMDGVVSCDVCAATCAGMTTTYVRIQE